MLQCSASSSSAVDRRRRFDDASPRRYRHGDDLIVTPFAQILASLRNVRNSFVAVCNLPTPDDKYKSSTKKTPNFETNLNDAASQMAQEAIEELDWCLEQLETVQTHRSVSEMASNKFRKLLNKELSHFAESSKSGGQISKFLINTYMDHDDEENNTLDVPSVEITSEASTSSSPQMSLLGKAKTAAMSRISGVRRLKTPHGTTGNVPEYGVECAKEIAVYMQQGARSGKFCAQKKDGFILRWVTSITSRALFALTGVLLCARVK
ncbi:hypothetical protein L596_030843 [Steinernema carpocapsae]|uniref:3',5'-cyclic-AMP phosphodiesterase n=1 Tax=Steinernema carpocapsae TaxID=34508 RepID=A0A4U5LND6_STECR|nr:hypothetical protein L596_030843 [Steinernema carpocapsae]